MVLDKQSDHSYKLKVSPNRTANAHRSQLWGFREDELAEEPFALYHFLGKAPVLEVAPDEYIIERVLRHWTTPGGEREYFVKWEF